MAVKTESYIENRDLADRLMRRWMQAKELKRAKRRIEKGLKRESTPSQQR